MPPKRKAGTAQEKSEPKKKEPRTTAGGLTRGRGGGRGGSKTVKSRGGATTSSVQPQQQQHQSELTTFIDEQEIVKSVHLGCMRIADEVKAESELSGKAVEFDPEVLVRIASLVYDTLAEDWTDDAFSLASHANRQSVNVDDVKFLIRRNQSLLSMIQDEMEDEGFMITTKKAKRSIRGNNSTLSFDSPLPGPSKSAQKKAKKEEEEAPPDPNLETFPSLGPDIPDQQVIYFTDENLMRSQLEERKKKSEVTVKESEKMKVMKKEEDQVLETPPLFDTPQKQETRDSFDDSPILECLNDEELSGRREKTRPLVSASSPALSTPKHPQPLKRVKSKDSDSFDYDIDDDFVVDKVLILSARSSTSSSSKPKEKMVEKEKKNPDYEKVTVIKSPAAPQTMGLTPKQPRLLNTDTRDSFDDDDDFDADFVEERVPSSASRSREKEKHKEKKPSSKTPAKEAKSVEKKPAPAPSSTTSLSAQKVTLKEDREKGPHKRQRRDSFDDDEDMFVDAPSSPPRKIIHNFVASKPPQETQILPVVSSNVPPPPRKGPFKSPFSAFSFDVDLDDGPVKAPQTLDEMRTSGSGMNLLNTIRSPSNSSSSFHGTSSSMARNPKSRVL